MTDSIALMIEPRIVCVARMWRYVDDGCHCSVLDTIILILEVDY